MPTTNAGAVSNVGFWLTSSAAGTVVDGSKAVVEDHRHARTFRPTHRRTKRSAATLSKVEDGGGAGSALDPGSGVDLAKLRIAAIVPCHNEEAAVGKVVEDLLAAVPTMDVYVYDNRSTDATSERAREAGAIVRVEDVKGKGNVVRRALATSRQTSTC